MHTWLQSFLLILVEVLLSAPFLVAVFGCLVAAVSLLVAFVFGGLLADRTHYQLFVFQARDFIRKELLPLVNFQSLLADVAFPSVVAHLITPW